ncbi:MAG: energy-coupling factor ABC transporter permease [Sedimentisphaerales bacterium]|nr:energy-coupling factor ABC transporter permease [Sedimentisphaerales bacterium]
MANELLSVPVAISTLGIAGGAMAVICRAAKRYITSEKVPLMGILGAFIFAAQMVNFQLPLMPGTSGHLVGSVLLAIILGPHLGAIVITSVVILQCLIFQDGGILAIGCNIINMGLVPSYIGYGVYRVINPSTCGGCHPSSGKAWRVYLASICACIIGIESGAMLVPVEAVMSGVLSVPFKTFFLTMAGVHVLVGLVEGVVTAAVLGYLQKVRPDIVANMLPGKVRWSKKAVMATFVIATVIIGAGLSLLASEFPDGLEWSYFERPDQPDFKPVVHNESLVIAAADAA